MSESLKDKTVKGLPIQDKVMNSSNNTEAYLVYVKCMTFNHAQYIVDAMDGFCIQNTNFPYVCVVMDDASTDGEQDEIRNYLQDNFDLEDTNIVRNEETEDYILTFARHKTNHNCFFAVYLLKYNHYSIRKSKDPYLKEWRDNCKYIAICEGDDYWTDSDKLQIQTDFLKTHMDYSMCFHKVDIKVEEGRDFAEHNKFDFLEEKEYTKEDQLRLMRIVPTCSILIRRSVLNMYPHNSKFTIGDVVVVATALTYGRIWCMSRNMGCYRLVPNGWTAMSDENICRSMFSHYQGMIEEFDWYKCKAGYKTFDFWAFSLLTFLKDNNNKSEFNKIADEYKSFYGIKSLRKFWIFYYNRKVRAVIRKILGRKLTSIIRNMHFL